MNRTPDMKKGAYLLPDRPHWGFSQSRLRSSISLLLVGVIVLCAAALALGGSPAHAQAQAGIIAGLTLTSEEPGTLTVTWDAPTPTPNGYDVSWSNKSAQSSTGYTTDTTHTFTDLNEGEVHKVWVRARYERSNGPWSANESITVAWQAEDNPAVVAGWVVIISKREVARIGYAINRLAADDNPETLDLTFRADVVDAGGEDFDLCEHEGMGEDHNLYIIDEIAETFYVYFGNPVGDCYEGEYTIIATIRDGSGKILNRGLYDIRVSGGPVWCVGCGLLSMPTISGDPMVGETLTADTSGISIPPRWRDVQFAYQWISHDGTEETEIPSATHETYSVAQSDLGKLIKVRVDVTYTDEKWDFPPGEPPINVGDATFSDHAKSLPTEVVVAAAVSPPPAANSPATGAPTINGTAQVGETLTATTTDIGDADGLDDASFTYQWLANDTAISGATDSTYTLVATGAGRAIKVRVSFIDDRGNQETLTSAATGAVTARPNSAARGAPTISGTAQVGETLTASTMGISDADGLTNATFTYQWLADDTDISGATSSTYTLGADDEGKAIKVRVTFNDDRGRQEILTSAVTGAAAAAPSPLTASIHDALEFHDGATAFTFELRFSEAPPISYRTLRDHAFTVTGGEVVQARRLEPGKNVKWEITVRPSRNAGVTISLSVTTDCSVQGAICMGDGRKLSSELEITVSVQNFAATGAPAITGTARVEETLAASTTAISDANGLTNASFTYQWLADDTEISGATGSSYTLTSSEQGIAIKVRVTFTDDAGHEESLTSAATAAVAARPNLPATGVPTITGTAQVGETLTAGTTAIADADGLTNATFGYQWLADDTEISGATGSSYILTSSEQGKAIEVRVTFTDDAGHEESLTSAATAAVAAAAPSPFKASVHSTPASHDGSASFTFELRFSETPKDDFSYRTLRDHAFTMTGGEVVKARRLEQGKNVRWEITVRPNSNGDVTIVLPVTTDCDAQGAVCTEDGRMLSQRVELTVSRPSG